MGQRRLDRTTLYSSASNKRIATFLAVGFTLGLILGYIAMGTLHAFFEIGAERHHGHDLPADQTAKSSGGTSKGAAALSAVQQQEQQQAQTEKGRKERKARLAKGGWPTTGDTIHVLFTSNGSPYLNFQTRIMYATYKLVQQMPGGEKMVAFTRILHRTKPDVLMSEVPTFRADPLTPKCDDWCEYPVSDRPNAVRQFFDAIREDPSMAKAPWLYMIETDYVWVKPLQAPGHAESKSVKSLAFPFSYIQPAHPNAEKVMRKYYPTGPLTDIPNTGPAPALMRVDEWMKVTPAWEELAAQIERDPESVEVLGWVREMYAFSLACVTTGTALDLTEPPHSKLIVQPPADHTFGEASAAHYTWGAIFKDAAGKDVWQFDKRTYTSEDLETRTPFITEPPPDFQEGWHLQDGVVVDRQLHATMLELIKQMNRGVATLKNLA